MSVIDQMPREIDMRNALYVSLVLCVVATADALADNASKVTMEPTKPMVQQKAAVPQAAAAQQGAAGKGNTITPLPAPPLPHNTTTMPTTTSAASTAVRTK